MPVTSIRLHPELEQHLEALSKKLDRSKDALISQAVMEFIAKQDCAETRWRDTQSALESSEAGRTVPAKDVFDWMRSWGSESELPRPEPDRQ